MQSFTPQLIECVESYIDALFNPPDAILEQNLADAKAAGMPAINVSSNQGKLLYLLAKIAGARRVLEVGTLGGYSTTWLARALPPDGLLVTLELDAKHAQVARRNLNRAGLTAQIDIRVGRAADSLRQMIGSGTAPFDLVFLDADKTGYVEYLELALQLSRPGTLILADNVIRHGNVLDPHPPDAFDAGAKAFNEAIARDPRLESIILPIIRDRLDGLSISLVRTGIK